MQEGIQSTDRNNKEPFEKGLIACRLQLTPLWSGIQRVAPFHQTLSVDMTKILSKEGNAWEL